MFRVKHPGSDLPLGFGITLQVVPFVVASTAPPAQLNQHAFPVVSNSNPSRIWRLWICRFVIYALYRRFFPVETPLRTPADVWRHGGAGVCRQSRRSQRNAEAPPPPPSKTSTHSTRVCAFPKHRADHIYLEETRQRRH